MDDLTKAILRTDFTAFIRKVFETVDPQAQYLYNWHIGLIAEYLLACERGEIKRLIINVPPRHLKSISVAVAFPAWLLGHNPSQQIMSASYSSGLSQKHSMDSRLIIQSEWYKELFPELKLVDDQNTKNKFVTDKRGYRIATSVGGTVTGEGGNFLIVDDPVSAKQADSEQMRSVANDWFDRSYSTRLNDKRKGCIIVIMQRLHENDLTGHLLRKGGWEHLKLPLIAEEEEVLEKGLIHKHRQNGDILHEARMGELEIENEKRELGPYGFAGQYQQRPSPVGGGKFKKEWIQYYEKLSLSSLNFWIFVDPANSKTKRSDYTSAWVFGAGGDRNYYIADMIRDRLNLKERIDMVFQLHMKYKPKDVLYQCFGMEGDIQAIQMEMERRNYRFNIIPVKNMAAKEARIERLVPPLANKRIYFPRILYKTDYEGRVKDLMDEFIHQELEAFPMGLHDDMLDALSMMFDANIQFPGESTVNYDRLYTSNQWSKL